MGWGSGRRGVWRQVEGEQWCSFIENDGPQEHNENSQKK